MSLEQLTSAQLATASDYWEESLEAFENEEAPRVFAASTATVPVVRHTLRPGTQDPNGHIASWVITENGANTDGQNIQGYQHCLIRWAPGFVYQAGELWFRAAWRFLSGSPGRLLDFHTSSHDPSHRNPPNMWFSYTKSGQPTGVAPIALDWYEGKTYEGQTGLILTLQAENDDFHRQYHWSLLPETEMRAARAAQRWIPIEGVIGFGRPDLPRNGYVRLKLVGETNWRLNLSNVATTWYTDTVLALIQGGGYWNTGLTTVAEDDSALIQLGPTRESMLANIPSVHGYSGNGTHVPNGTYSYADTPEPPPQTVTSSTIKDGDTVQHGQIWGVTTNPAAQKVELWADGAKLNEGAGSASTPITLSEGQHKLGVAITVDGVRTVLGSGGVYATIQVTSASSDTLPLHVVSQTTSSVTLGWTPVLTGRGYTFWTNGTLISRTNDPARRTAKFNKKAGDTNEVRALVDGPSGIYRQ